MKYILISTATFLMVHSLSYGQIVEKETKESNGVKQNITATETDMYNGTESKEAKEYYEQAVDYGRKQDYKNAKKYYLKAIKEDPEFVEAYDNLGRVYRRTNEYDKAIEQYQKSIELYPDGIMAHQNLAVVYGLQNEYEKTIHEYNEIIRIDPENAEGYFGLGNSYLMQSKFDEALENAEKAVEIYEKMESLHLADGYYLAGLITYYMEDLDSAKEYLSKAKDHGARINPEIDKELFGETEKSGEGEKTYTLEKEEDYALYEEDVVQMVDWLIATPVEEKADARKEIGAFVVKWVSGAPNISVEINADVVTYIDCSDCLVIFLGGWAKYVLVNEDDDKVNASLAATKDVIQFYKSNKKELGKNKEIEKLIKLEDDGELKTFIKKKV